jgi:putative PEP-CTERM system TPR-repeat lipoprotein
MLFVACRSPSDETLLASARTALQRNDPPVAVGHLKALLQRNPASVSGRFLLGQALLAVGDPAGAVVELEKARLAGHPADEVLPPLAEAFLASGQAKKLIDTLSGLAPSDQRAASDFKATLAAAQIATGNLTAGRQANDDALKLDARSVKARLLQARLIAGNGGFDEALAIVDGITTDQPNNPAPWGLRGELLWRGKHQADAAEQDLRKAIALEPRYAAARATLIDLLLHLKKRDAFAAEVDAFKKALPAHPDALYYEAQLALLDQRTQAAREMVQRLLGGAPDNPYALQLAGAIELQAGALSTAESHLNRALTRMSTLPVARRLLADVYLRSAQPAKALAVLQPLLSAKTSDAQVLALAATAQLQAGSFEKAEALYKAAADADPADTRAQTALALARVARGDTVAGFSQLESLAATDASAYSDLALISARMRRGELDAALHAVDKLVLKQESRAQAHHVRGQVLMAMKNWSSARASFEKALSIDPMSLPDVGALAALDLADKNIDQAVKRYQAVLSRDEQNVLALLALAGLRAQQGAASDEIVALLDRAIKARSDDPTPRLAKVQYLLVGYRTEAALNAAQDTVSQFPANPMALDALGRAQLAAGQVQQAIATFRKIVLIDSGSELPFVRLAEAQLAAQDYVGARQNFSKALELRPRQLAVQRRLLQIALLEKRPDDALRLARTIQKERPNETIGVLLEADVHIAQRAWDAAIGVLRNSLAREPATDVAQRLYGTFQQSKGAAEAAAFAEKWAREHPRDAEFIFHVGTLAVQRNDLADAEVQFRKVTALLPEHAPSINNLAWLLLKQGKPGAGVLAARATQLAPDEPTYLDTLAQALAGEGRWPEAIDALKKAIRLTRDAPDYRLALARTLISAGDKAAARVELQRLQSLGAQFAGNADVERLLRGL